MFKTRRFLASQGCHWYIDLFGKSSWLLSFKFSIFVKWADAFFLKMDQSWPLFFPYACLNCNWKTVFNVIDGIWTGDFGRHRSTDWATTTAKCTAPLPGFKEGIAQSGWWRFFVSLAYFSSLKRARVQIFRHFTVFSDCARDVSIIIVCYQEKSGVVMVVAIQ